MARVYLDEMLGGFARPLSESGHDVVAATDEMRRRQPDAWHFRQALNERRVLLTHDRGDFEYLHSLWTALHILRVVEDQHAGILSVKGPDEAGWLEAVQERLNAGDPIDGQMLTWIAKRREWQEAKSQPVKD